MTVLVTVMELFHKYRMYTDTDTALTHFRSLSTVLYCRMYIEKVQNTTVIKHCIRYVSQLFIFSLDDRFSYSYGIVS